jgi:hypothetical protein
MAQLLAHRGILGALLPLAHSRRWFIESWHSRRIIGPRLRLVTALREALPARAPLLGDLPLGDAKGCGGWEQSRPGAPRQMWSSEMLSPHASASSSGLSVRSRGVTMRRQR